MEDGQIITGSNLTQIFLKRELIKQNAYFSQNECLGILSRMTLNEEHQVANWFER